MNEDSVTGDMPILIRKNGIEKYVCIQVLFKYESESFNKYYKVPKRRIMVWSDRGFTEIKYIMKHKSDKQIFCIVTTSGIVKVTEDHSLLKSDGSVVRTIDVKIGDILLCRPHPLSKIKVDNEMIFENCIDAVKYFGRYDYIDGKYIISPQLERIVEGERKEEGEVLKIIRLPPFNGYVYDLETENHHFSAGLGDLVVHNSDN